MSNLNYPVEEIEDGTGVQTVAYLATCDCQMEATVFYVFQAEGRDHFHIQCAQCEQSYCLIGHCVYPQVKQGEETE